MTTADFITEKPAIVRECYISEQASILNILGIFIMQNQINQNEINMLRTELELLMRERQSLLKVTGAAAGLIAEMNSHCLLYTSRCV